MSCRRPAFSLMMAKGLLISWATPAASRPIVAMRFVYSTLCKTAARLRSASRIRFIMYVEPHQITERIRTTLTLKKRRSSLRTACQLATCSRGLLMRRNRKGERSM